jgi:carboxyl-terminal processing protease
MNRKIKIIYPVLLAIAVIAGVFLGANIQRKTNQQVLKSMSLFQPDKLSLILKMIEKDYVDTINKTELIEKAIPVILEELDPHTSYIPASDMKSVTEEMRGNFSGIGVQFVLQNDTVMIVDVVSGGPSKELGILAGDRIIQVNDESIVGKGFKSDSVVSRLRGPKNTKVKVKIFRPGFPEIIDYTITRGEIPIFSVDVSYMVTPNIGLIKVNRFAETTHDEFVQSINKLKKEGANKLIIDLRGNSGGYLQAVFEMVDEFLTENKLIVYTEGKARSRYNYLSTNNGIWKDNEVAVLIDEFSASASEIFAGAIQDNDRGIVVGRRSFGKGLVQEQIPFLDGSALRLTVARFYTPSGRCIQKSYDDGIEEYYKDFEKRLHHNELSQKDSIHFNDTLKYYTTGGRLVYGGGGIMPDFFVPADTTGMNKFYAAIISKNLPYSFAFDYSDKNRKTLKNFQKIELLDDYLTQEQVFETFIDYAKSKGVQISPKELKESKKLLQTQINALISRNINGDSGFYPIIFKIDQTVLRTVELLDEGWNSSKISALNTTKN